MELNPLGPGVSQSRWVSPNYQTSTVCQMGGGKIAISKTLIENVSVVKKAETWHSLVVHWYSFENCIECVGGRDETMVFFLNYWPMLVLANFSLPKLFVVFSPHFSSSLQKCSVVFFFPTFSFVLWSMAPFVLGSHGYLLQVAFLHPGAWMAKVSQS